MKKITNNHDKSSLCISVDGKRILLKPGESYPSGKAKTKNKTKEGKQ